VRLSIAKLRPAGSYLASLALVALVCGPVAGLREVSDVSNSSMLFLLPVLASAVLFGRGQAVFAAVASFFAYDLLFVEPLYTLTVSSGDEYVALGLLLVTGMITGQLAALLRQRALEAGAREKEAVVLYDVVRLMVEPELERALTSVAERLRRELALAAVLITFEERNTPRVQADVGDIEAIRVAQRAAGVPEMILGSGQEPTGAERGQPGRWIRVVPPHTRGPGPRQAGDRALSIPIDVDGRRAGSIVLVRGAGASPLSRANDRLLIVVANQLGLAMQRLRLRREATEAEILRRTDELRTALLNAVSHDLRTPLSSIIASAGSLLQQDVQWTEAERREFTRAIVDEAGRLNRLVGNLLDLSRIEAGSIRPEKGWYDLGALVDEVAGRLRRISAAHALMLDVPEHLPPVQFDYVEIDQVISNLIENAVKYTPDGTTIRVSVRTAGDDIEIEVTDSGPGIPEDSLGEIFLPFYRAASGQVARPQGSGLGLAVARGLVEAHGGRIWAENRREGGARFVFTLPLSGRPAAAA
jgi:two-component system sensor histidine kinase KdpD